MANKTVIGRVPTGLSPELRRFLSDMSEQVQIQGGKGRGDTLDRAVTFRDLKTDAGISKLSVLRGLVAASDGTTGELYGDAAPSAPTGVEVLPTFTNILVKWDRVPNEWYRSTEVFRVTALLNTDNPDSPFPYLDAGRVPVFSDAVQVATTISPYFTDEMPPGTTGVYWVRHVNRDGQSGPVHATSGSFGTTRRTPLEVLEEYSAEIYQSDAYAWLRSELASVDALNRGMIGAGFNSGMATLLASNASVEDILAEQSLATSLDKHAQRFDIKAQFSKNYARLSGGVHAAVNSDEAYVQRISSLESQWVDDLGGKIDAKVTTLESALTSPTGAIATSVLALDSKFGLNFSDINKEFTTIATESSALAERATSLEAIVDVGGDTVSAQLESLETAIAGPDGAIASAFDTYSVSFGGTDVTLDVLAEAVATNDTNHARWGVKTDVNGKRGGVVFDNNGIMTNFLVDADVFAITNGASLLAPFIVKNDQVVMQSALIDHADIFTLIADNITAKTIAATTSLTSPVISGGSITGTTLDIVGTGGKSMSVDAQGFLEAEGAEFKSITIRDAEGNVQLSSNGLSQTYIDTLFGVNATFKGTVYAENIEGDVTDSLDKTTIFKRKGSGTQYSQVIATFYVSPTPFKRVFTIDGGIAFSGSDTNVINLIKDGTVVTSQRQTVTPQIMFDSVDTPVVEVKAYTNSFISTVAAGSSARFELSVGGLDGCIAQNIVAHVYKRGSTLS